MQLKEGGGFEMSMTEDELREAADKMRAYRSAKRKHPMTIRMEQGTIDKAKDLLGNGYTTVFRNLIIKALDHPEMLRDCL